MNNNYDKVPRYRKKKPSDKSKARKKANHTHQYEECLFECDGSYPGFYCKICGKMGSITLINCGERLEDGCVRMLSQKEVKEKLKNLPIVKVESLWQKYMTAEKIKIDKI